MTTVFSMALIKARKEAGFQTAYRFHHAAGDSSGLNISYRAYLRMEQGEVLPSFEKLDTILVAMRLIPASQPANDLVAALLRVTAGEKAYNRILKPLIATAASGRALSPIHKAMKKQLTTKRYNITPAQLRATLTDFDTYLCSVAMVNDTGVWSAETLAKALKLEVPSAVKAMKILARAKMLKKVKKGQYMCPLASMTVMYPALRIVDAELKSRLLGYHKRMKDSGSGYWMQGLTIRADSADFHNFSALLTQDIETAASYAVTEKTPTSAIYAVEAKITKMLDF